ncbi:hypothetical protein INN84_16895, partial [Staphylococcus aureus]|nr:hypothetical protein [Staphylococcus aureus]
MNSYTSIRFSLASRLFLELRINSITLSKIDKEVMVPSEEVILSMTRHGYIKRTSIRSFNASGVEDIGLK